MLETNKSVVVLPEIDVASQRTSFHHRINSQNDATDAEIFEMRVVLSYISPMKYDTWTIIGMALKASGYPLDLWEDWSKNSDNYKKGECGIKWQTFSEVEGGVTVGTIYHMAIENGYNSSSTAQDSPFNEEDYQLFTVSDFQGKEIPKMRWLVDEWIPYGSTASLYGDGGVGKSLLAMMLMTSCIIRQPWMGLDVMQVNAIGFFCEDTTDELQRRQNQINEHYGVQFSDLSNMHWYSGVGKDNVLMDFIKDGKGTQTEVYNWLLSQIREKNAGLVVIDTAADTFGGNENSRIHVRQFIGLLNKISIEANCTVVLCAHPSVTGMQSGAGTGGNTAWNNSVRARLYFRKLTLDETNGIPQPNLRVLEKKKSNYSAADQEIRAGWHDGVFKGISTSEINASYANEAEKVEKIILEYIEKCSRTGLEPSNSPNSTNYAPKLIMTAKCAEGLTRKTLASAMARLLYDEKLILEERGTASRSKKVLVINGASHE